MNGKNNKKCLKVVFWSTESDSCRNRVAKTNVSPGFQRLVFTWRKKLTVLINIYRQLKVFRGVEYYLLRRIY